MYGKVPVLELEAQSYLFKTLWGGFKLPPSIKHAQETVGSIPLVGFAFMTPMKGLSVDSRLRFASEG